MCPARTTKVSELKAEPKAPEVKKSVVKPHVLGKGVGRRKSCVARVFLKRGAGTITVNGRASDSYFDTDIARRVVKIPFEVVPGATARFDAEVLVCGGGLCGQAAAVQLGISRALLDADADMKATLRQHDLLTVDARVKERKKYGRKAARRRFQFVKR